MYQVAFRLVKPWRIPRMGSVSQFEFCTLLTDYRIASQRDIYDDLKESFMFRVLQDFKLVNGDEVGEILWECPMPEGIPVENVVHDRMAGHYKTGKVQAVRVIDKETGDEIYRWTWWNEYNHRLKSSAKPQKPMPRGPKGE
jgi:hypothetical protein